RTVANFQTKIDVFSDFLLQDVCGFIGRAVIFDQCLANFIWARANELQLALEQKTETVDRIDVEWIAYRHNQPGLTKSDRNHFETARLFASNLIDDLWRNHDGGDVDPIHVRLRGERARDVHVGHDSVFR